MEHPQGPVLLTVTDLAAMQGLSVCLASQLLREARQQTGKALLTIGYFYDQGLKPSPKAEIVALYEQGFDELEVAHRTGLTVSVITCGIMNGSKCYWSGNGRPKRCRK